MDMTEGEIIPIFAKYSLPLLLGNAFQLLYSITDSFIVGNYCGTQSLAAIGASANIIFTITGFFNGLAGGAGVLISHAYGAKDAGKLHTTAHTAIVASVFLGILLSVFGICISPLMLAMIAVPADIFAEADSYLRVYFSGMTFILFYNMCAGILRSLGDSKHPLHVLVITVVLNVALDYICILVLRLGLNGAAWATVASEGISALLLFPILKKQLRSAACIPAGRQRPRCSLPVLHSVLRLGLPNALSNSLLNFSNTFMQRYINAFGASCMAGWSIYTRFDQLAILPMVSISVAAMTFTGQNYGAGKTDRVRRGIKSAVLLGIAVMLVISAVLIACAPKLIAVFNAEAEVVLYGAEFIRASASFYVICFCTMVVGQITQGLGFATVPTVIIFMGFVVFRQAYLFLVTRITAASLLVALAYPLSWPPTLVAEYLYLRSKLKKMR
ncbi:MAG TPA: MATE family efflux transporter [Treponema sp.]|nr:MATE family efflux transporter [Treponema sp.]